MERLMVALEEVPPDMFRTSLLRGLPQQARAAGGRSSPSRRSGVLPGTPPDRKSRVGLAAAQRAPSPLGGAASSSLSNAASGVLSEAAAAAPADTDGGAAGGPALVPEPTAMPPSSASPPPPPLTTNSINDERFFPDLPDMILGLAERLSKVIEI